MDEQLPAIQELWDPVVAQTVRSRIPATNKSKKVDKQQFLVDIHGVYHAIGGDARLAHTANEHPQWFYNRFLVPGVLLPNEKQEIDMTVHIHPALQRSALDGDYVEVQDGQLDQGGDQASGSAAQGARGAGGSNHSGEQDGRSLAVALIEDSKASRTG